MQIIRFSRKVKVGLFSLLGIVFFLLLVFYYQNNQKAQAAELVMLGMLEDQQEVVINKSNDVFNSRLDFANRLKGGYGNVSKVAKIAQIGEQAADKIKSVVVESDSLINWFGRYKKSGLANSYQLSDNESVALTQFSADVIGGMAQFNNVTGESYCVQELNSLPDQEFKPLTTLLLLRTIQIHLLDTEKDLISTSFGSLGTGWSRIAYPRLMFDSEIVSRGEQGKAKILLTKEMLPPKPHQFQVNKVTVPFNYNNHYCKPFLLQEPVTLGYQAEIHLPTSENDLGAKDEVKKTWEATWSVPVSYFRDSLITINGSYKIRRKCS